MLAHSSDLTAKGISKAILISGLILPSVIMDVSEWAVIQVAIWHAGDATLDVIDRTLYEVFQTLLAEAPVVFMWNLIIGWPILLFSRRALQVLSTSFGPIEVRVVAATWLILMITKGFGPLFGLVEQGYLLFPPLIVGVDILSVSAMTGWTDVTGRSGWMRRAPAIFMIPAAFSVYVALLGPPPFSIGFSLFLGSLSLWGFVATFNDGFVLLRRLKGRQLKERRK